MLKCRVKITGVNQKTVYFKNPKCGHLLEFNYSTPFTCQDPKCTEKPAEIDRLISEFGQAARVKYFAEGTIT